MPDEAPVNRRPTLTESPPIRAVLKAQPSDFEVEEVAKIEPSGSGEHCWCWIEKRDLTTPEAARRIARALGVDPRSVGWAGLKDRHAVTRQWLSLPATEPARAIAVDLDGLRVLQARRHPRKLRSGALAGNRFTLLLREVDRAHVALLRTLLEELVRSGAPNYFGAQRFGREGRNIDAARAWLLQGQRPPRNRFHRKLFVSVLQSAAFNDVVAQRIEDGTLDRVMAGDLLQKTSSRATFRSEDPATEQARLARWELSPTGPMFGAKMQRALGAAGDLEARIEAAHGLGTEVYRAMGRLGEGTRRPLRVRVEGANLEPCKDGVRLSMTLPAGAYATEVLRELFKGGLVDASRPAPPTQTTEPNPHEVAPAGGGC